MKWFTFVQNNSGGYFVKNDDVCEVVCIEAESKELAIAKAESIMDNSDSCPCCGDRWTTWLPDSYDVPSYYGDPIETCEEKWNRKNARLHHADGRIETLAFGSKRELSA